MFRKPWLAILSVVAGISLQAVAAPKDNTLLDARLAREKQDYSFLPKLELKHSMETVQNVLIESWIETPAGEIRKGINKSVEVKPNEPLVLDLFPAQGERIAGEIVLASARLSVDGREDQLLSAVCGTPKPVDPAGVDVFGMNVHLRRYDPATRWKLLKMMKRAGVSSVRVDFNFCMPEESEFEDDRMGRLEEEILALEAFGIEPMVLMGYFPAEFYGHPEKMRLAHDWAKGVAQRFKGRASWQYGNETNSGWGAYGAARDMAALNNAFALGTLSADPLAKVSNFGIADGTPAYLDVFLQAGGGENLNAIAIHPYCGTAESGIAKCLANERIIGGMGGTQELWVTEIGFHVQRERANEHTGDKTLVMGFSLGQQSEQLVRLYTLAMSKGVERVYWYDFYGKDDIETFWIVDAEYNPLPAYNALVELAGMIKGSTPLDGSDPEELVQRHLFKRPDGSVVMVCWALKDGVKVDWHLPADVAVTDIMGRTVDIGGGLELGHGPVYVSGLDPKRFGSLRADRIMVSALDQRSFKKPLHRFRVSPAKTFEVPFAVHNASAKAVEVKPVVAERMPGWKIALPEGFAVPAGQTIIKPIAMTVPANAVEGVEYRFGFAAQVDGFKQSNGYSIRVKTEGEFPYRKVLSEQGEQDYPMWDPMDEACKETGQRVLSANNASAEIDGDLTEWNAAEFYPIDQKFMWILRNPGQPDTRDWSGRVALRWDEQYLYAAFLVLDDDLGLMDFISRDWRDNDNVRLFLSAEHEPEKLTRLMTKQDWLFIVSPTGIEHSEGPVVFSASLGEDVSLGDEIRQKEIEAAVKAASRVWAGGYIVEMAVPLAETGLEGKAKLGLNVLADDNDEGYRQHTSMTYFKDGNYWRSPKTLGTLILNGK